MKENTDVERDKEIEREGFVTVMAWYPLDFSIYRRFVFQAQYYSSSWPTSLRTKRVDYTQHMSPFIKRKYFPAACT